jgi:cytochrome c556
MQVIGQRVGSTREKIITVRNRSITMSTVAAAAAALALTACGGGSQHTAAAAQTAPTVTCSSLAPTIAALTADQAAQDKSVMYIWLMGGKATADLQHAVRTTAGATPGEAAYQLHQDAQTFFADTVPFGDGSGYMASPQTPGDAAAVKADIEALGAEC